MGFVSKILESENNIQLYYIIGLFIFLGLFIVVLYKTIKMKKQDILQYKNLVFEDKELHNKSF